MGGEKCHEIKILRNDFILGINYINKYINYAMRQIRGIFIDILFY